MYAYFTQFPFIALIRLPEGYPRPRRVYCFFAAVNGKDYSGDVCCEVEN